MRQINLRVRIPEAVHIDLKEQAKAIGVSLNALVVMKLMGVIK